MKEFSIFVWLMLAVHQFKTSQNKMWKFGQKINLQYGYDYSNWFAPGFEISPRDETIEELDFSLNKKIRFLPIKVARTFSNLLAYFADSCSLTEISKDNFENLVNLTTLSLRENQTERIASDTFEDLKSLRGLYLGDKFL